MTLPSDVEEFGQLWVDKFMPQVGTFTEKIMVFIDGEYWRKCLMDQFSNKGVDLNKIVDKLVDRRKLLRTYFYTAKIENPPNDYWRNQQSEQQRLFHALAHLEYIEVREGRLRFDENYVPKQKGVDVLIAIDMLRFALKNNYDTAILISGDGDFADIVNIVKDEGCKVEIVSFVGTLAPALRRVADLMVEVTPDLLKGCWLPKKTPKKEKASN